MRLTLTLAAAVLLVGAGCSAETKLNTQPDSTPLTQNQVPDSLVDLKATSTNPAGTYEAGSPDANKPDTEGTVCTMDVKQCPDGSYVGRTGPNCEFAACPGTTDKPKQEASTPTEPKSYTLAEVKLQATAGKCWTIIDAKVYDLSAWISKHPGGEAAIKSLCGIDGTAKFKAMHGGAAKPEAVLASYQIGVAK